MILRVILGIFSFVIFFSCATFVSAANVIQKSNPPGRTLSSPDIRKGDQALLDLWFRISQKPIKLKSKQEWKKFNAAQICSQNICMKDPNLTCLRAIPSDPDKKCQQLQREKIVKEISAFLKSRGCLIPAAAGDSLPSVTPSGNKPGPNNTNNNFPAGSNDNTNNGQLKPGVKPQKPNVPHRPHGEGTNPWLVPAAAGALIAGLPHYNNVDDRIKVPGNDGTPQNNGLLDLNSGKPGKPEVPSGYVPGAPRPSDNGITTNNSDGSLSVRPDKPGYSNNQFRVDSSCSEQAMLNLGKKYRESMIQFVKSDDDMRDSFDPDKSTVSLFNSSLEILNVALLSKSDSIKRSSIYLLKEWIDAYFSNMKSYFPIPLKAILDKACNCFLDEENPSYINRSIKAFLKGSGYFKK